MSLSDKKVREADGDAVFILIQDLKASIKRIKGKFRRKSYHKQRQRLVISLVQAFEIIDEEIGDLK